MASASRTTLSSAFATLTVTVLTTALAAQTVHQVGAGGFATIQAAIAAAANGDVIVIQAGVHLPFTLNKDLTLTAAPGATVDVQPGFTLTPVLTIVQPPARAAIVGLRFRNPAFIWWANSQVRVLGGTVAFADCAFESHGYGQMLSGLLVQNANVAMQRCLVLGGGVNGTVLSGAGDGFDGLEVRHANVAAVDCVFMGGALGWDNVGHGGHAVFVDDGNVQLTNCIALGGRHAGFFAGYLPGDGVHIASPSRVWLADCQLRGGDSPVSPGGRGLANLGGLAAVEARSLLVGGAGVPMGAPAFGPLTTGPLPGFAVPVPPIEVGTTWTIAFRLAPTTPLLALWSDRLLPATAPLLAAPAWLPPANLQVAAVGVSDANGLLPLAFPVPNTPALVHTSFFVQGIAGTTLPLQSAAPVGGVVR